MKKIDAKSMMIGFLLCSVLFLSVGFKSTDNHEHGKYQAWASVDGTNFMINTSTGELYKTGMLGSLNLQKYSWKIVSKDDIIKK